MPALFNKVDEKMKKVLLVDDDLNAREALRMVLESQQLECIEVSNGSEAIDWLAAQQADLIISDNQMPVLTGLEFIDQVQSDQKILHKTPIILLSGHLEEQDKFRARQAGVFAILDKPCNFSQFLSIVQLALDQ
jgi:two-component system, chemotaxis family, chemotaxis protein CheY